MSGNPNAIDKIWTDEEVIKATDTRYVQGKVFILHRLIEKVGTKEEKDEIVLLSYRAHNDTFSIDDKYRLNKLSRRVIDKLGVII